MIIITDINECEDKQNNNCSHHCNNTEGSYQCSCPSGYIPDDSDGFTCLGICCECMIK